MVEPRLSLSDTLKDPAPKFPTFFTVTVRLFSVPTTTDAGTLTCVIATSGAGVGVTVEFAVRVLFAVSISPAGLVAVAVRVWPSSLEKSGKTLT